MYFENKCCKIHNSIGKRYNSEMSIKYYIKHKLEMHRIFVELCMCYRLELNCNLYKQINNNQLFVKYKLPFV